MKNSKYLAVLIVALFLATVGFLCSVTHLVRVVDYTTDTNDVLLYTMGRDSIILTLLLISGVGFLIFDIIRRIINSVHSSREIDTLQTIADKLDKGLTLTPTEKEKYDEVTRPMKVKMDDLMSKLKKRMDDRDNNTVKQPQNMDFDEMFVKKSINVDEDDVIDMTDYPAEPLFEMFEHMTTPRMRYAKAWDAWFNNLPDNVRKYVNNRD